MSALTCDICGGNLAMNESGDFAVCESCGMKHTKERVKVKVQEIKGVVEITKGETEKERLLKNAETFIDLGKIDEAEEIYAQLVKDYPNDWKGWAGNAYIQLLHFPCSFSRSDIDEFMQNIPNIPENAPFGIGNPYERAFYKFVKSFTDDYRYSYKKFKHYSDIANKLAFSDFERYIEEKWKSHDEAHNHFVANIENMISDGVPCFDKILIFFAENAFIPLKLRKIIAQLSENAAKINATLEKNKNKYENFNSLGKTDFRFDSDGTRRIEKAAFLSSSQVVLLGHFWQGEYGDSAEGMIITFDNKYTVDQLLDKLSLPTAEEKTAAWIKSGLCEKCGSTVDKNHFCTKCRHINVNNRSLVCHTILSLCKTFPDHFTLLEDIYSKFDSGWRHHLDYNVNRSPQYLLSTREISKILIDKIDIISDSGPNTYIHYTAYGNYGIQNSYSLTIYCDDIPNLIKYLYKRNNLCVYCGGHFKGIFTKVCSKCGKPKDY